MVKKSNSLLYGIFSALALLLFYLTIVSLFQGIEFALMNLRSLWYLIFPLVIGFGIQIGLFFSIKHRSKLSGAVTGSSSAISGGSMVACCSHFLLNMIPLAGASGIAIFLVKYQSWFLILGILSNIVGIT